MKRKIATIRIKEIYRIEGFSVFCLFSNEEYRYVDFEAIFSKWKIAPNDPEYPLLQILDFQKVSLLNGTLTWENIRTALQDEKGNLVSHAYQIDPLVLYQNSQVDTDKMLDNLGLLLKNERIKSVLSIQEVAQKSGVSEEYITKLENEKSNIELLIIRDILKKDLGKSLQIKVA